MNRGVRLFRVSACHYTPSRPLTVSTAMRTLNNPRYAGVYAYGRRRYRRTAEGQKIERRPQSSDWIACLPNAHPGYLTWEQYQENLRILESHGGYGETPDGGLPEKEIQVKEAFDPGRVRAAPAAAGGLRR